VPFIYNNSSKSGAQALENLTTSSSVNTETDVYFLKPGATRPVALVAMRVQGKGAGLTALSGIVGRIKQWTASASTSTGGTSVTPTPKNNLAPACVATAGITSTATSTVTVGTTALYCGLASMGASGPGGWVAINPDDVPTLDGGASKSLDLVFSCPTASLNYEFSCDNTEC
jgi:hypothetical protein